MHKAIIREFEKCKVYSSFKENIWDADPADMHLLSIFNKVFRFLLHFIDINSKYGWVVSLKDQKAISITKAFQKKLNESNQTKQNMVR